MLLLTWKYFDFLFFPSIRRFSSIAIYSKRDIFHLAQEAYDILEQEETDALVRINEAIVKGVEHVDLTLFSQDIIVEGQEQRNEVLKRFLKRKKVAQQDLGFFGDLRLFLRKWLSECFVGVMSRNGASLVWDFLFLHKFSRSMSVNVCLAIFHLLRPSIDAASDFRKLQTVLLEGPKVLLIRDLRRVLQHFSRGGGAYSAIPGAPSVPNIVVAPPSAREDERRAKEKRIEALNQDFLFVDDD